MFGLGKSAHKEIGVHDLAQMLRDGSALVVDVREPEEFADGHVPGAVNVPLSTFNPASVPHPGGKTVVLNCLGGKRSGMALDQCAVAQAAIDTHLAGGFKAWADAGLPVER